MVHDCRRLSHRNNNTSSNLQIVRAFTLDLLELEDEKSNTSNSLPDFKETGMGQVLRLNMMPSEKIAIRFTRRQQENYSS